jgi:hypothetical protein
MFSAPSSFETPPSAAPQDEGYVLDIIETLMLRSGLEKAASRSTRVSTRLFQ